MKVLIVTNMYPLEENSYYGIFVKEYVESIQRLGIHVDVVFTNGRKSRMEYFWTIPEIKRKILGGGYDIIHAQHTYCVYQILFGKLFRTSSYPPIILTLHEGEVFAPTAYRMSEGNLIKQIVLNKNLKKWACNKVDHVVSVERKMIETLGTLTPSSIIPPGVDMDFFKPLDRATCRERIGIPIDGYVIFFPASPTSSKGFHLLKESLALIKHEVTLLVGGNIPRSMMPYYVNAADVVVQTSLFEASPMVIKEAMSVSVPIVTTDVGDSAWVMGETPGCYVCPTNPPDIARSVDQALDFGKKTAGRERITLLELSLEQVAKRYLSVYQDML